MNSYSRNLKGDLNEQDIRLLRQIITDDINQLGLFDPTNLVTLNHRKYRYFIDYNEVAVRGINCEHVIDSFKLPEVINANK